MEMIYDYIIKNYESGEPIFSIDLKIENISYETVRQQLKRLTDTGYLERYDNGIYYLPKESRLKGGGSLSSELVARYKYISRLGKIMGYYAGHTFANQLGISTQVPYKPEIVSNNFAAAVRDVKVGEQIFTVRRSRIPITDENYKVLQLLELLKDLDEYADEDKDTVQNQLAGYVESNGITRDEVDKYIGQFPIKIYKAIYEMRLERVFA